MSRLTTHQERVPQSHLRRLENRPILLDIAGMAKMAAKAQKTARSRKSELTEYTAEGLPLPWPRIKPKSFTLARLRRVVADVKREQALAATADQMAD